MQTLTNVEVGKVFKGKSGEGQYGPWQIHDVYLRDDKRKLTYFEKDGLIPEAGMIIQVLKFEVVQKGEYTNYTVKELTPDPNWYSGKEPEIPHQKPPSVAGSTQGVKRDSSVTMYVSYAKDLMVALLGVEDGHYFGMTLEDIAGIVAQTGVIMYDKVNGIEKIVEEDPNLGWTFTQDTPDDEPPFPDEPPPY